MSMPDIKTGTTLQALLEGLVVDALLNDCGSTQVSMLAQDNRTVRSGCLFIASEGFSTHGLIYAEDAVAKGAVAVIWDGDCDRRDEILDQISNKVACIRCADLKNKVGEIAARFYKHPSHSINVVGITGTDGKTSIAHYLAQALDEHEIHCGIMGTLGNGFINDLHPTGLTTVDALQVQASLFDMQQADAKHAVMEVSSHGLDQGRVNAVQFDVAVFSNLAHDHLDYHKTREDYAQAKRKLFYMPGLKVAVINLDDEYGRELAMRCREHLSVWGYSTAPDVDEHKALADYFVHCKKIVADEDGLNIAVNTPKGSACVQLGLLGSFNVSNVLAVLATLLVSGVELEIAVERLRKIKAVSGRMQKVPLNGCHDVTVIIDYAHTAQALEAACQSIREHFDSTFWCIFGCGGDRDQDKRPLMAAAAEKCADHVIVTSDNPRHENPDDIIAQITQGFTTPEKHAVRADRKEAIRHALSNAKPGDVVLIAGKGHESSQIIGDVHIAFNDYRVAQEVAEAMD